MDYETRVRGYFDSFVHRDWERLTAGMSEDFTFTSQYDDHISKDEFRTRCLDVVESIGFLDVDRVVQEGSDVFVRYRGQINGQNVQNVEHFVFEAGMLKSVTVFFGRP